MTKLEWCRENAPESMKNLSDAELLEAMQTTLGNPNIYTPDFEIEQDGTYTTLLSAMDYMVLTLVREFGDNLTFKGGYMLSKLLPETSRQTTDIDFSIQDSALYTQLLDTFKAIGEHFVADGFITGYAIKQEIRPFMTGGMDMYAADGSKRLGVDVGWHNTTYGWHTVQLDICDVKAFTTERMLADKISAILSRKRFRRPKDIYDVYCITNCFDFDANDVHEYILNRTDGVGAEWQNFPFNEDILREYAKAYAKLNIQSISNHNLEKPAYTTVLERFSTIVSTVRNRYNNKQWNHQMQCFEVMQ